MVVGVGGGPLRRVLNGGGGVETLATVVGAGAEEREELVGVEVVGVAVVGVAVVGVAVVGVVEVGWFGGV